MFNTAKDRQEKKRRRYLKAHDETYKLPTPEEKAAQADLDRSYNMTVEDLHSAIRMTCSKPGPSDNSRAAYRHEVKMAKERILNKTEQKEIAEDMDTEDDNDLLSGAYGPVFGMDD